MGYYVTLESSTVRIPADNVLAADQIMRRLNKEDALKGGGFGGETPKHWFSWVDEDYDDPARFPDVPSMLRAWRFMAAFDEDGSVVVEYFEGEKLGDEEHLFRALAPVIEHGSEMYWQGEEGERWRWRFFNGGFIEQMGTIVWPD